MSNKIKNSSENLIKIIPNLKSVINIDNEKTPIPFITQKSVSKKIKKINKRSTLRII